MKALIAAFDVLPPDTVNNLLKPEKKDPATMPAMAGGQPALTMKEKAPTSVEALRSVGVTGFEPATTCTPCKCATGLRYTPRGRQM